MEETLKDEIIEGLPAPSIPSEDAEPDILESKTHETLEELITRHKREQRDLQARIIALKKTATKGDKKRKKEVTAEIATLESEIADRHVRELKELEARVGSSALRVAEVDDEMPADDAPHARLAALTEEEQPLAPPSTPGAESPNVMKMGKKPNKSKLRLAKKQAKMQEMRDQAEQEAAGQVDMAKIENDSIVELVKPMGLSVKDITPDGHCLYNAMADQLKVRDNISRSYQELRHDAASYMRKHPADFIPFLCKDDGEPFSLEEFRTYCDQVENTAVWGGQLEMTALSKAYRVPIHVIQMGLPTLKVGEDEFPGKTPMKISWRIV